MHWTERVFETMRKQKPKPELYVEMQRRRVKFASLQSMKIRDLYNFLEDELLVAKENELP